MLNTQRWQIEYFCDESGVAPFREWFESLDQKTQARVDVRLDRVQLGNFGDYASVGEGVFELRFHFGPGYRVHFACPDARVVLLLACGDKDSQIRDIRRAKAFRQAHMEERQ